MQKMLIAAALFSLSAAVAQAAPPSVLTPIEAHVRALVLHAQPRATFATAPNILIGQYRTENHTYQPHDAAGRRLPSVTQLGPLPHGGFYLQLNVAKAQGQAAMQSVRPSKARPWTTVISTYPLKTGKQMIVMTWEATSGAPRALPGQLRAALLHYAATK